MNTETHESYEDDVEEPVRAHPVTWTIIIGSLLSIVFLIGYFWIGAANDEPVEVPEYTYVDPNAYRGENGPVGDPGPEYTQEELKDLDEYDVNYLEACYAAAPYTLDEQERVEHNASCLRGVGID